MTIVRENKIDNKAHSVHLYLGLWQIIALKSLHNVFCPNHPMHIAIRPIVRAFETLQESFLKTKDDIITLKKPLEPSKWPPLEGL